VIYTGQFVLLGQRIIEGTMDWTCCWGGYYITVCWMIYAVHLVLLGSEVWAAIMTYICRVMVDTSRATALFVHVAWYC